VPSSSIVELALQAIEAALHLCVGGRVEVAERLEHVDGQVEVGADGPHLRGLPEN
jgi:hypothetical protein